MLAGLWSGSELLPQPSGQVSYRGNGTVVLYLPVQGLQSEETTRILYGGQMPGMIISDVVYFINMIC